MTPLTYTDLYMVHFLSTRNGWIALGEPEPLTSEAEAAAHVSEHLTPDITAVSVIRCSDDAPGRDVTEDVLRSLAGGRKADAHPLLHPFINDPDYDAEEAGYVRADDAWAAE